MPMARPRAAFAPEGSHALQTLRLPVTGRPRATTSRVTASMATWWDGCLNAHRTLPAMAEEYGRLRAAAEADGQTDAGADG